MSVLGTTGMIMGLGVGAHACTPALKRLGQEGCRKFTASLVLIARPAATLDSGGENAIIGCSSQCFQFGDIRLVLLSDQEATRALWRGVRVIVLPPTPDPHPHTCLNAVL